jgi:hypothetical protein
MTDIPSAFAASYVEARAKFAQAARAQGLAIASRVHPQAVGAQGEALGMDLALLGNPDATSLLVVLSGVHGVEGFCGSGCQVALLQDEIVLDAVRQSGAAVLFCHAVNPYGFSHLRRTNEDNIDVNRNFRDFAAPLAANPVYASLHSIIIPPTWPPTAANAAIIDDYLARYGAEQLQAAVSGGQCDFPDGLFYAGRAPAWSNTTLRDVLREHGLRRERIGWIDIHSGLGAWGHGEKIYAGPDDAAMIARARTWYGCDVTSFYDGTSTSAALTGVSFHAALDACPQAEFTGIGIEYGTQPLDDVFDALRAEQWLANHPEADEPVRLAIKRQMRGAFHDDRDEWKMIVYGQARVAVLQALRAFTSQEVSCASKGAALSPLP